MAMATDREYADMVAGLAYIRRTGRFLARLPDWRLAVSDEDAGDVEYVNECLGIVLRGLGVEMEGSIPPGWEGLSAAVRHRWCAAVASRQAGLLRWGLRHWRIRRRMVPHNDWCNVDCAETHLRDLASYGAKRKGRFGWHFRGKR